MEMSSYLSRLSEMLPNKASGEVDGRRYWEKGGSVDEYVCIDLETLLYYYDQHTTS